MAPSIFGGHYDRRDIPNAVDLGKPSPQAEITLDFCIWLQNTGFDEILEDMNGGHRR